MKKTEKISVLISIVLISLIAIGAVSAADDTAAADDADLAAVDEVQTVDSNQIDDDVSYKSEDIVVTSTGDSGDDDVAAADNAKDSALGANDLTAGEKTFTELNNDISTAQNGIVMLQNDYKYDSSDSAYQNGIDLSGTLTIIGGGHTIDGNDAARIFNIAQGANIVFVNLKLTNAANSAIYNEGTAILSGTDITSSAADKGAAIYNTATGSVDASNCKFNDNTAVYRGGAIYSEGTVKVTDSTIDSNNVTYRAANDDNGGAAIYNKGGTLELDNVQVTNNLLDIVIREGNAGDLINAAVFTSGVTTIANSNFYKNGGSWGGAIYGNGDADITVTGTSFSENFATFGAAIYAEGAKLTVDDCDFISNACVGVGSPGTESTQGAAILGMAGSKVTITDSAFFRNIAKAGGAVSLAGVSDSTISGCTFTQNEGTSEGGAIYAWTQDGATVTVSQNTFIDNTAPFGSAISNDGTMSLSENTITGSTNPIGNYYGTIVSDVYVNILNNATSVVTNPTVDLFAELTDDQGNVILDRNLVFTIEGKEVQAAYNKNTGLEEATYTLTNPGTYVVSTNTYTNVKTGTITFESSLSALQALINEAQDGATIDLTYGYGYLESLDSTLKDTGIIVNKNIILNGNGVTIDGADVSRLFKVTNGATLTLNDVVVANGFADDGACVYVDSNSKLTATGSTFKDSVATYSGGAIYALGEVSLTNCIVDNNDITDRSTNNNTGGAAIFLNNTSLTLVNTQITNNGKDFKYSLEYGAERDLLSGVVQLIDSDATISGSLFENNAACYGGALNIINTGGTVENLKVTDSQFINNKAYNGAGINIEDTTFEIDGCTFTNNQAIGVGSPDYVSVGGGVSFDGANSAGTITDSTFTGNSATIGGAIYAGTDDAEHTATISGCTFTDNTATEKGGAIVQLGFAEIKDSTFTGNSAPTGEAIYIGGPTTLSNNVIDNYGIYISQNQKLNSNVIITINDNGTYEADAFDIFTIKAKVTDDNGNIIRTYNDKIGIWCGASSISGSQPGKLTFNEETGLYEADFEVAKSGVIYMGNLLSTFPYVDKTLVTQYSATINIIKNTPVLTITVEDITEPADAAITISLFREDGTTPINANNRNVYVDGVAYKVNITNGIGTLTVPGLTKGEHTVNFTFASTAAYNAASAEKTFNVRPIIGTYSDLVYQIGQAADGVLNLPYDFAYDADYDGAYLAGGIDITKTITINGNGKTISGSDLARVFYVTETGDLTLNGVTITHGNAIGKSGGAIINDKGTVKVIDSTFTNNKAGIYGGAICNYDGDVTVSGANTFTDNEAGYSGGAIFSLKYDTDSAKLIIDGTNAFSGNKADDAGGAIYVYTGFAEEPGLTITGTNAFTENEATYGGAIFVNGKSSITGENTFTGNKATGTVDDYDAGGAIYADYGALTIDGAKFNGNEGPIGGALYTNVVDLKLSNAEFTDNTAVYGGALYIEDASENEGAQTGFAASVSNSVFSGNTATEGNAIYTDGALSLSGNTVSTTSADIVCDLGTIKSKVLSTILENKTYDWHMAEFLINATLADDNGNLINDYNFKFLLSYTAFREVIEVPATYNSDLGYYQGTFTPDKAGEYLINLGYENEEVATSVIKVYKSLTDLANIIAAADAGAEITLDDDYAYIEAFDSALVNGIVIDKDITIKGAENANIINGSDLARLFKVTDGKTLTLDGVTIANGKADDGAGIYVDSGAKLVATGSTFKDNTATYSGGAIYADNAQITLTDCVLDGNDATDATSNNDTGGAAIYGNSATIALVNTNVTNNGNKELDRTKGDLINGVINLMNSDATVTGCVFENNTGIYGGAITTQAPAGAKTLTISESNFTANAAYTGGAVYVGDNVKYTIEDSIFDANNKATGEGSPGYTSGGGAIQIWHAGEGTIDNVTIKNSIATQGGAIGVEGATVTIKDSTFEGNTATSEGGAIYAYNDATTTVTGCTFTDNDAPFGSAISNDGTLSLSGNTMTGGSVVPIGNYYGTITSTVNVVTLDGQTVTTATATNDITAVLKDDNGNAIVDRNLVLIVNNEEITTIYNKVTGIMTGSYTFTQPGTYAVTAKGIDADHTVAGNLVYTAGTFTELQNLINAAEAGATITLDHDIVYNEAFDGDALKEGIVVDKAVTIVGADGIEICGNDLARVFKVANAAALTLKDITICDGAAEKGAGVFVESGASLVADNVTFTENVAVKRGGAVYSEGAVNIANSRIDKNNVTYRSENDDNGGAAIYNLGGTLTVTDTNITDNQNDIVPRDGNSGDYINSAIITTADASFTGCNISKNSGSWGGGIYVNNGATLTVKDSVFEENFATFGAAIYDENAKVIIDNCNFTNNYCGGVGSPGTSNTQAGAVLVMGNGASATITNSKFNKNSAKTGGAVSISQATGDVLIDNCEFTENTASYEGGAIYNYIADGATLSVSNSKFTDNTATNWGDAISNDGALKLDKNTITGGRDAAIGNWLGTIDSKVVSRILENTTYNWHTSEFLINATLTDDNGNKINDKFFKFIITYTAFRGTIEVPATYYSDLGYYQGKFTPDKAGEYLINLGYENEEVATSVITVHKSLIDLANLIANDEDGIIDLDDDYAYIAEFDESIVNGIVIDKAVTINGAENANIINGSNLARLFDVTNGGTLTLNGVTIANGKADDGAGIYLESGAKLTATGSTFKDNTATYSGGAIYADGAQITLTDCVLDGNDVTDYTKNNDTGGAAIYGQSSTIALVNTNVTNNGNKELDRTKGDLVNGVINLMNSDATVTGCVFENNTGIYGGAITTQAPAGAKTLTISESNFTANAAYTGGAVYVGDNVKFTIEDSIFDANNKATGEGSPGYTSGGGAIQLWHAGEGTIDNVTIKNSIATQGGAIGVEGSSPVTIKDSTFTDNTATSEGGAIYAYNDAVLTVTGSTFSGNTAPWGNAISNDGTLTLSGNTVSTTSADIANYYGSIVSPISVSILGNDTTEGSGIVTAALGETVTITGVITDDNGNLIRDINFDYKVTNGDNIKEVHAVYNANTKQYEAEYVIENAGDNLVSITSDANTNLLINTGLYQVEKAKANLIVTVENIKEGEKAKVEVELIGADDTGLAGQPIIVRVNDVDYEITTGDDGKYSFEIDGLDTGRYDAVAVFEGNANYKLAFNSTIFDVKAEPGLSIFITDSKYGEHSYAIIALYSDGTLISGIVDITISGYDYPITVVCEDGGFAFNGYAEIPILPAGTYTYTATSRGTEDYLSVTTEPDTFTVSPGELTVDFTPTQTVTGQPIAGTIQITDENGDDVKVTDVVVKIIKDGQTEPIAEIPIAEIDGTYNFAYDGELAPGEYTLVVSVPDQENYPAATKEFELVVEAKSAQAGVDLGAIDITDGETTTVYITVGDGKVYAFTSYGDDDDEGPVYSTGTVLVLEEGDEWTKVVVLTNDADPSYVGREFYVESDDAFWHMKELYLDEGITGTGIYVRTHESGVVPQDIDGTATITVSNDDGFNLVITDVPITNGKGEYVLPVLPMGEYFFTVTVDAEGYDIAPAEFYDCLVVWVKEGTYTDLQQKINDAIREAQEDGRDAWLDLEYDFAFDEAYDLAHGINFVTIDGKITINGNGHTISGSDLARIFYVNEGASLEIMDVTLAHASVTDNGAAIYTLGDLTVHDATIEHNKVTQGTTWAPGAPAAGGAAIYAGPGSQLDVWNVDFNDNTAVHGLWNSFTCGAVYASGANYVNIRDSRFKDNAAVLGGAITIEDYNEVLDEDDGYDATIRGCEFENNLAWQGGAINVNEKVPVLTIKDCTFKENKAVDPNSGSASPSGGAISVGTNSYATDLTIEGCDFNSNSATNIGGAIAAINANNKLTVEFCSFEENNAVAGGAIYFYGKEAEISNSNFVSNDPEYGGALYIATGDVSIEDTQFNKNEATQGGAIYVANGASLSLKYVDIGENTAEEGSAIYANYGSSVTIEDSHISDNTATGNYGAVFLGADDATITNSRFTNNKGGNGGAIFWTGDNGKVTYTDFENNEATEGYSGGAIFAFGDNIEIDDCSFYDNTAAVHGGAIAWFNQGTVGGHNGKLANTYFVRNKAGNSGGAIYWTGESGTIDNCRFEDNTATVNGAALMSTGADMTISNTVFFNNAGDRDGAIYFAGNDADLIGDIFENCHGAQSAIILDGASIKVVDSVFQYNEGVPIHYNILNAGTIESITGSTFRYVNPTIVLDDSYVFGENILMTGTFDWGVQQPAITMKFTINGIEMETTVLDGKYRFNLDTQPPVGTYTVVISSFMDDKGNYYEVNTAQKTFEVTKATPTITATGDVIDVGETATVTVTVMDGEIPVAGIAVVTVNGVDYIVTVGDVGTGSVDIENLPFGEYPIAAKFLGNDDYEAAVFDGTAKVVVESDVATFDIVIENITYGEGLVVIVENATDAAGNPLNGMVIGNIENATGQGAGLIVYVANGKGSRTYTGLTAGDYDVVATFYDDDYEWFSETKEFTVNVAQAEPTVGVTYADGAITITLDGVNGEKLNETVTVAIDGTPVNIAAVTENGTFTFTPTVAPGAHLVEVEFAGNHNYVAGSAYTSFEAPKLTPTITITGDVIDVGETATVTVTVMDGTTPVAGNAVVTVNGVDYAVTIADNGKGTVDIDGLAYGEYPIAAKFLGNDDYEAAVFDGTAKVVVESDVATFDIVIENITYGEGLVVIVENATDAAGNPLNGMVIGNIENATGQGAGLIVYVTNGKGSRTYTGLTAGDYDVVATFYDDDYEWFSKTKEFTVNVAQAEPTVGVTYADGAITITLDGVNGEKLNETVTVAIDGTPIDIAAVTENGTFTFTPSVAPGAHLVEVDFTGNHNYVAGSAYTSFEAPKLTPTITVTGDVVDFEEAATVNVTVMDGETPVAGNAVVTVNGVNYAVTIGADGKGFVDIENLPFGEYPITAKFLANDKYEAAVYSGDAKVVVNMPTDVTFDLAVDDGLTTVTVSDATNAAGEAIDGYVMGVLMKDGQKVATLDMGTLADGTGTLALPADLDAGDYTVMVTVKDGDMKLTGTDEINFTVEPKAAVVTGDAADYAFDQTGKLEINVTDVAETPIAGNVTVVIDEGPYATVEINGNTVIDLTGFDIGAHIVKVIFTNPNYRDAEWVGGFNVTKVTPTITVTGDVVDFEEVATVNVTVMDGTTPVAGNAVVTVNGVNYAVTIGADGKGFVDIENLPFGEYPITAKFLANDKYEEAVYSGNAKVVVNMPTDVTFDLAVDDDLTTVTVSNAKDAAGNAIDGYVMGELFKDGQKVQDLEFGTLEDGTGTIAIPAGLDAGDYTVMVTVMDDNMASGTDEINFTVEPKAAVVTGDAADYAFDQTGKLEINVTDVAETPIAGNVTVVIDEGPYATVEINGNTVIDLTGFDIGAHIVKVIFTNPNYRDAEWVGGFNVTKVTPTITVTGSTVDFEEVATVTVAVMAGETPVAGNAVVTVNGVNYAVEIGADGTGTLTIAGLAANEYPITAKFLANDKYEEAVYSGDAKVVVGPSKDLTIEVTANEPSVGQDTIITVTATDGSGAAVPVDKVNVTIDGVTTEYPVAADGTVNIGALPAGETPVTVSVDDGVHTLATKDITAVVSTPTVLGTNITVTVDNITYGESAVIKFTLTDENNNPLTGILNVTVKDIVKEVPVDDGHGTLTLPSLTADTYPVVANFEGNDAYGPSTGTGYFNVAKKATKIIYENMTTNAIDFYTDGRVGEWFVWRLVDEDGNPMKNTPMQIGFNGIVYTYEENGICTDDDGYARLQINLMTSFTYTFAISFLGDENYNASFAVAKIDVLKQTPTITVPNKSYKASASTKTLTATFKNNRGTLIANKTIKFTVNGKTYSAKTDEKGVAKVNVSISKAGTYDVTMTYGGSGTYEKVTKKATLKIT